MKWASALHMGTVREGGREGGEGVRCRGWGSVSKIPRKREGLKVCKNYHLVHFVIIHKLAHKSL